MFGLQKTGYIMRGALPIEDEKWHFRGTQTHSMVTKEEKRTMINFEEIEPMETRLIQCSLSEG
jgi:hypothetical protein